MTKTTALALALALALTLTHTLAAADWTPVATSQDGKFTLYADTGTVLVLVAKVQLLTLTDYQEAQVISATQSYKSVTMQDEFDCDALRGRHINLTALSGNMGKGVTVATETKPAPERSINPATADGDMLKFACARR